MGSRSPAFVTVGSRPLITKIVQSMIFPIRDDVIARTQPVATYTLLALNTAMMIFVSLASPERQQVVALRYGFIPARLSQLTNPRPLAVDFDVEDDRGHEPRNAV